jgi:ABC-2 type transport system ATP-binding protein
MDVLTYNQVCKSFGEVRAVKPLDLSVPQGEIFGLLGPNGAGKTTLIRMTLGIILPDAGTIQLLGRPRDVKDRRAFGYLPEERGLYPKMKVLDLLLFFGRLRGLPASEARTRALAGLKRVELSSWAEKKVEELSKGMQQKIQLLVALLHRPKVAILDEPFSGLDPVNVELFKEVIRETRREGTNVVLSTHQMEQVEALCEQIALVNKGEVVLRGHVDEIRRRYGIQEVRVQFGSEPATDGLLTDLVESAHADGREVRYRMRDGVKGRDVAGRLIQAGCDVVGFAEAQASMHEIFVRVVKGGGPEGQPPDTAGSARGEVRGHHAN